MSCKSQQTYFCAPDVQFGGKNTLVVVLHSILLIKSVEFVCIYILIYIPDDQNRTLYHLLCPPVTLTVFISHAIVNIQVILSFD